MLSGGEPLINRGHQEILQHLIEKGESQNIKIEYNTNLSVIPPKLIELWSHFKKVKLFVSLDGIGDLQEPTHLTPESLDSEVLKQSVIKINEYIDLKFKNNEGNELQTFLQSLKADNEKRMLFTLFNKKVDQHEDKKWSEYYKKKLNR